MVNGGVDQVSSQQKIDHSLVTSTSRTREGPRHGPIWPCYASPTVLKNLDLES